MSSLRPLVARAGPRVRHRPAEHASAPAAAADIPRLEFEKFTLPNGLEVILSPKRGLPMVAVNLWYHVGPANEAAGRTGFAHLFEHMMFQGSKHVPRGHALQAARSRRRERHQRHDRLRPHQLLRDGAVESARARAVARVRPHGLPAREGRPDGARQPAGRRAQRAAAERREPAVRHGRGSGRPDAASRRPSLLRHRDRLARRHPGGASSTT